MTYRFWVWINRGWVRLTLTGDQVIRIFNGGYTEEGASSICDMFELEDDRVVNTIERWGRDCDGPYSQTHVQYHAINALDPDPWFDGWTTWTPVEVKERDLGRVNVTKPLWSN